MAERPEIFNHNVETVGRLYRRVRPKADLARSLELLRAAKRIGAAQPHQVGPHGRPRRGDGRGQGAPGPDARPRHRDRHHRSVPASVAQAPPADPLLASRRVRRAEGLRQGARLCPCRSSGRSCARAITRTSRRSPHTPDDRDDRRPRAPLGVARDRRLSRTPGSCSAPSRPPGAAASWRTTRCSCSNIRRCTPSGRRSEARHLGAGPEALVAAGAEFIEVDRGGSVTFHGPGQLVAYPIVRLNRVFPIPGHPAHGDIDRYLRALEAALIATAATYGVEVTRRPPWTGVWSGRPQAGRHRREARRRGHDARRRAQRVDRSGLVRPDHPLRDRGCGRRVAGDPRRSGAHTRSGRAGTCGTARQCVRPTSRDRRARLRRCFASRLRR